MSRRTDKQGFFCLTIRILDIFMLAESGGGLARRYAHLSAEHLAPYAEKLDFCLAPPPEKPL
jgi:hypothetical protein